MSKETKKYLIKIPVYISEKIERESETLFSKFKLEDIIEEAENKFNKFNQSKNPYIITQRSNSSKTTAIAIERIDYERIKFNKDQCLLLKVTAFKTNFVDGFYQSQNKDSKEIRLKQNDKIGSNTYCFILYPISQATEEDQRINIYWHIFIYEDPSKTSDEMRKIANAIMRKIIGAPIHNIKADKMMEDLRKCKILPEIEIVLSSLDNSNDDDDLPLALKNYAFTCSLKKEKRIKLNCIKVEDAIDTFEDQSFKENYSKRGGRKIKCVR